MKRALFLSSLTALLLVSPAFSSAQPPDGPANRPMPRRDGPGSPRRPGGDPGPDQGSGRASMMQRRQGLRDVATELGLTDVQKADVRKAVETSRRDRLRKSTDLKIASMDLRSLLRAEKVDEKAVGLKLAEVQAAQASLAKLRVDTVLAMKRILTPEQQKKMSEMRGARGARGQGRQRQRMKMRGAGRRGLPGLTDDDDDSGDLDDDVLR